jgi:hypothetical protein
MQQLDEKQNVIVPILDRLRRHNLAIGNYQASMLNSDFQYSVKLSNGRIIIPYELVQDFEQNPSFVTDDRFQYVAATFGSTNSQPAVLTQPVVSNNISHSQTNCNWCAKPMDKEAIRCQSCGKLRKDIYEDKIKCYSFSILGALPIGAGIGLYIADKENLLTSDTTKLWLTVIGSIVTIVGLFYYVRASEKMKSYWWV